MDFRSSHGSDKEESGYRLLVLLVLPLAGAAWLLSAR
jgi:hypothetical protein